MIAGRSSAFSSNDFAAMETFESMVQEIGSVLRKQMLREPPKLDAGLRDLTALAGMGLDVRRLSPDQRYRFAQMMTGSARSMIERWFESDMVKAMYASACFSGNFASLDQPGSAIPFFHMAIGELDGELGAWRLVKGGMGGISEAMASFARSVGVEIRTDAPVAKIRVADGQAVGVQLEDGEVIASRCVLANTDPKRTFLELVDRGDFDDDFARDIEQLRMGHSSMKVNLALDALPDIRFPELRRSDRWTRSDITMFPDVAGLEAKLPVGASRPTPGRAASGDHDPVHDRRHVGTSGPARGERLGQVLPVPAGRWPALGRHQGGCRGRHRGLHVAGHAGSSRQDRGATDDQPRSTSRRSTG